jgi:hypothetical protein
MNGGGKNTTTKTQRIAHMVREIEQLKKKLAQGQNEPKHSNTPVNALSDNYQHKIR